MLSQRRSKKIGIALILGLLIVIFAIAPSIAQTVRYPTYEYYGRVLSVDEFLELVDQNVPLACIQVPSVEAYRSQVTYDYACFHTQDEVDSYFRDFAQAEWERITQEDASSDQTAPKEALSAANRQTAHWALYANTGYSGWLADVANGTTCRATSTMWSMYKDGSPNNLTVFPYNNCTGTPSFTLTVQQWACLWPWPLSCGNTTGAHVP